MKLCRLCFGIWALLCFVSAHVNAQQSLCAEVKIEILQEVAMERQGFEALMRITNSLDSFSLENVSVTVNFKDADGNAVIGTSDTSASNASFFIRVDGTRDLTGFSQGADGKIEGGIIAPKAVGEMRWLIIPTAKAAGQTKGGKLYFVGAQLKYSYGGKDEVVDVAADSITVKPQPALTLDYFLTQEVVGDNGFTPEVEPAEPYTLGVRISNNGFGYAKSVKIESAQPTIVENKQGLAVGFKILGSYLADQPSDPTLLINFGNIEPKGVATGRWIMESNLAGNFVSFNASFTHADELGGTLTSLLQATNANFLVRDVVVDLPGRDRIRDFLAYNSQQQLFVFESEVTGLNEVSCTNCKTVNKVDAALNGNQFTHFPQAGFSYAVAPDPYHGTKILSKIVRADGTTVHPQNAWLSKTRAADKINFDYFINVFDNNSVGSYTVYWGDYAVDVPQAPVIQFLSDRVTYEGGNVSFAVLATDPNKTTPNLSIFQLPVGANFTLSAINQGVFTWSPVLGQAGNYPIKFIATDGTLNSERSLMIRVNPANDTDGDGMDDAWERKHFGDLSHDGSLDSDGDGRSDLQEFLDKTDPKVVDALPAAPQILSPIFDADTLQGSSNPLLPTLSVTNGHHPTSVGAVNIVFEVYRDESLTDLMATATVDEGTNTTSTQITSLNMLDGATFDDNHLYYWRAKSQQKTGATASSAWVKSQFFINTANDAPSAPHISGPSIDAIVADLSPVLSITNSTDIDRDRLSYSFALYEESDLSNPVASASQVSPDVDGQTHWHLPKTLQEDHRYVWQAKVDDGHGAQVSSEWGSFLVSLVNSAPTVPVIAVPADGATVQKSQSDTNVTLSVTNSTDPERSTITYYFEMDKVNTFDSSDKRVSAALPAGGQGKTSWVVNGLLENQTYYWRVRAYDGQISSDWSLAHFTFSVINEAPSVPTIQNPANASVVATQLPLLEVNPSVDPEGKVVTYKFQLYANAQMTTLVSEKAVVNPRWQIDFNLADGTTYYWRARAEDADGVPSGWTALNSFTVKLPVVNEKPVMTFVQPNADIVLSAQSPATTVIPIMWTDSDSDSDAKIDLFLTDAAGNRTTLARQIDENSDGAGDQFMWQPGNLAPGVYRISAEISDEVSVVTANACCKITVPPTNVNLSPLTNWLFDENTGTQTQSAAGSATGTLSFSTVINASSVIPSWVSGRAPAFKSALSFDGKGGYVSLPASATSPLLGKSSLSFWVNTTQQGAIKASFAPAVIGYEDASNGNDITWGSLSTFGQIGLGIGDARLLSLTPVSGGAWHHVVMTRDVPTGSTKGLTKIYIDGVLNSMGYPYHADYKATQNLLIGFGLNNRMVHGQNLSTGTTFFGGKLDDIQIYDRVLSASEVNDLYQSQFVTSAAPVTPYGANGIYEAEAAVIYLGRSANYGANYSGTGFADYDGTVGSYVEWAVDRSTSGNATVTFRYSNTAAADVPMSIMVNGVVVNSNLLFPYSGAANAWGTVSVVVNLNQGINTIRATSANAVGGPNIDYIKIE